MLNTELSSLDDSSKNKLKNNLNDFYIPYRKILNLPSIVTFGTEIEFKHPKYNENYILNFIDANNAANVFMEELRFDYKNWEIENEDGNHLEAISPVLYDSKATWQEINNVLTFLKNNDCYYSGVCGAHIHMGKAIFNENTLGWLNFFKMWYIFENYIFKFTNGEEYNLRSSAKNKSNKVYNTCKKIINDFNSFSIIDASCLYSMKKNCIEFACEYSGNQYYVDLNTVVTNYNDNDVTKTIEFRSPNGTLNKIIWQNNINFFAKMLLSCANESFDKEKLEYLYNNKSLANEFDLCDLVFDNNLDKYCFLRQYYKDFENKNKGYSKKFYK